MSDFLQDAWIDYAYYCMNQAGWKYIDCPVCEYPRLLKINILMECSECGDEEKLYE